MFSYFVYSNILYWKFNNDQIDVFHYLVFFLVINSKNLV
jgi:hypothetical protein